MSTRQQAVCNSDRTGDEFAQRSRFRQCFAPEGRFPTRALG
jgi:hypothetical protein